jgi:hypothetical protein
MLPKLLFLAGCLLSAIHSSLTLASSAVDSAFNPLAFDRHWQVANCPGINRAENKTVNLELRTLPHSRTFSGSVLKLKYCFAEYVDINASAKRTLLLLHGWPSLWASWKYQIQEFSVSGARC